MTDLAEIRRRWLQERPLYSKFVTFLYHLVEEQLKARGVYGEISGRIKQTDSLLKKLILRKELTYEGCPTKRALELSCDIAAKFRKSKKLFHPFLRS